jgi:hypothetical protein
MAAAAAAGSGDGKNIVAAQKNWEQRVNTELEATKLWATNWGELFEGAKTTSEQVGIKRLRAFLADTAFQNFASPQHASHSSPDFLIPCRYGTWRRS